MLENQTSGMPQIPFGGTTISRLILGSNPVNAISHTSRFLDEAMRRYFTPQRQLDLLFRAQELGIDTWQATPRNVEIHRAYCEAGGTMKLVALAQNDPKDPDVIRRLVDVGAMAIAHHGGVTDRLWREGRMDEVRAFCDRVHDAGAMAGVSMHNPLVLDHVLASGWDVDYFMCCLYELTRTREQVEATLGDIPVPYQKLFLESDPPRMLEAIQASDKPVLAFKLLAASRLCEKQEQVEAAFESTMRGLGAQNGVIVGMYPEFEDQVALNVEYLLRYHHLSPRKELLVSSP